MIVFAYISANKKKIIRQVTEEIGKKITGNVSIGNIELSFLKHFPKVSIELHDVLITDTQFSRHQHPFFKAQDIYLRLSAMKLIQKESAVTGFTIERGSFYVFTDTSGYTNSYLFKRKDQAVNDTTISVSRSELEKITLKDVSITIDDQKKNKLHDLMVYDLKIDVDDNDPVNLKLDVKSDLLVHSLAFNKARGSYLKDQKFEGEFHLGFNKKTRRLMADSINLMLAGNPFSITAAFDMAGSDPQFKLNIHTKGIQFTPLKTLLTRRIDSALSIVSMDEKIKADAYLKGPLKGGDPLININWFINKTLFTTPLLDFENASYTGSYTNEVVPGQTRTDANSKIVLYNFTATWKDLPITAGKIEIMDLTSPVMTCDLHSNFELTTLNDLIEDRRSLPDW